MSDFTKGPWKVEEIDDNGGSFMVNCGTPRKSGGADSNGNNWIGTVWTPKTGKKYSAGHRKRTLYDYREAEANAHLISAAPDMYEACKDALDLLQSCGDEHTRIAERLKQAINKADGKS